VRTTPILFIALALVATACRADRADPAGAPTSAVVVPSTSPPTPFTPPATVATTTIPVPATTGAPPTMATTPTTAAPAPDGLEGISMTAVPPDVIVPTGPASLNKKTNPINGGRGGSHPQAAPDDCDVRSSIDCLTGVLDDLGFDVTGATGGDQEGRVQRATAVVQLDAGLAVTGQPDEALFDYVRLITDPRRTEGALEVRQIGTSAQGRPIMALRFGTGPRTVLVVGQTHGDEEAGLRVLLRALSQPPPDGVTLWVVPTMNPDGLALDTRFLADGADPNRQAPKEAEQRAVYDFALAIRPALTVWYHQNYGWVGGSGASMTPARRYQALTRLGTLKHSGDCAVGFMWCPIDDALGSSSILVELPDVVTPADVQRHAGALMTVAAGTPS
jgi:hypothetical protein